MLIEFNLFDYTDNSFKRVYFKGWKGNDPILVNKIEDAKTYFVKAAIEQDVSNLNRAVSNKAKTLSINIIK